MSYRASPLPASLSLYLDCCRFLAAVLVVASHFELYDAIQPGAGGMLANLGRESVIVFFVLSGFVIAYTTEQKNTGLRGYCVARCTRIYSVALPLLLLAFAAGALLALSGAEPAAPLYQLDKPWLYLPLHLLFMGELWTISEPPPLLAPYWSLGYEVWYYALFGALFYLRGKRRLAAAGSLLLLMGPKLWLLLPVWASGVLAYHWQKRFAVDRRLALAGWCATLALLVLFKLSGLDLDLRALARSTWPFPGLPLKSADRYLADYLVCLLVLANFLCAKCARFGALLRFERPLRWLASYTFTLYLVHALVMRLWLDLYPHDGASVADNLMLVVSIALATWVVGQLTERRKAWFEAQFNRLADRLPGRAPTSG
jgi:peptidoglycan/LPS O-acetylase OafA/YrhL